MEKNLIVVKQLPVIEQTLNMYKKEIQKKVKEAMTLECTDNNIEKLKKTRAEFNKEKKEFEDKRKEVKKAVMEPYEEFEVIYKECITNLYEEADDDLKSKIETLENEKKSIITDEVQEYFIEYAKSVSAPAWLTFERFNFTPKLSNSRKKDKETAKEFIDKVVSDVALISTQEYPDEIMVEYQYSLDVNSSILKVKNRHEQLEEHRKARELAEQAEKEQEEKEKELEKAMQPEELSGPEEVVEEKIFTLRFTVKGTKEKLQALKKFLVDGGYDYE